MQWFFDDKIAACFITSDRGCYLEIYQCHNLVCDLSWFAFTLDKVLSPVRPAAVSQCWEMPERWRNVLPFPRASNPA